MSGGLKLWAALLPFSEARSRRPGLAGWMVRNDGARSEYSTGVESNERREAYIGESDVESIAQRRR